MDIDKVINIIREQRIDVSKLTAPTGGGGGTIPLTAQAKVRTWRASLESLIGGDYQKAKASYNDPQNYLDDNEYKNRPTFAQYRRAEADKVLAKKKPLPHHKAYKNAFGEDVGGPTNSVGPTGLQGDANPQGPLAGYDKPLGKGRKGKKYMKSNVSYKLWRRST